MAMMSSRVVRRVAASSSSATPSPAAQADAGVAQRPELDEDEERVSAADEGDAGSKRGAGAAAACDWSCMKVDASEASWCSALLDCADFFSLPDGLALAVCMATSTVAGRCAQPANDSATSQATHHKSVSAPIRVTQSPPNAAEVDNTVRLQRGCAAQCHSYGLKRIGAALAVAVLSRSSVSAVQRGTAPLRLLPM